MTSDCDALSVISDALPFTNNFGSNPFSKEQDLDSLSNDEMKHLLELSHQDSAHSHIDVYQSTAMVEDEYETDEDDLTTPVAEPKAETEHKALSLLWVSQLTGWCSMCSVVLFWTSFISIDIYQGVPDPDNPVMAYQWMQFKAGLVFGAYGLLLTALVSVNCSVLYPWLRKRVSTRKLYLVGEILMAMLCIIFFVTTNETWLLILISAFGFVMQIHMQSCHELTENELQPMFANIRGSKTTNYFVYFMELANVIAPVAVSLFAGPVVEAFDGEFKYLFLMAGCIQLVFDFVVLLMFSNLFFWKLPRAPSDL